VIGVITVLLFVIFIHEGDSRNMELGEPLSVQRLLGKFLFNPRAHKDFSWNFLGRALFYFGLTLNTTFTAFFFASRLGVTVAEVTGTLAVLSICGILVAIAVAMGGGFLSDKL